MSTPARIPVRYANPSGASAGTPKEKPAMTTKKKRKTAKKTAKKTTKRSNPRRRRKATVSAAPRKHHRHAKRHANPKRKHARRRHNPGEAKASKTTVTSALLGLGAAVVTGVALAAVGPYMPNRWVAMGTATAAAAGGVALAVKGHPAVGVGVASGAAAAVLVPMGTGLVLRALLKNDTAKMSGYESVGGYQSIGLAHGVETYALPGVASAASAQPMGAVVANMGAVVANMGNPAPAPFMGAVFVNP